MRCNVDGDDRPKNGSNDWVDDSEWGLVHLKQKKWHTVTGTALRRVKNDGFIARGDGPPPPGLPSKPARPGHPGLPSRSVLPEQLEDD